MSQQYIIDLFDGYFIETSYLDLLICLWNATFRGSEANFEFCKGNEKNYLVKSEYFRWFYDQIPSLVPKFKIFFFPLIFDILFSSETSRNKVFKISGTFSI